MGKKVIIKYWVRKREYYEWEVTLEDGEEAYERLGDYVSETPGDMISEEIDDWSIDEAEVIGCDSPPEIPKRLTADDIYKDP